MTPGILAFAKKAAYDFGIRPGRVLELGSLDLNGSVREAFPGVTWVGLDLQAGPGVDRVCDARAAPDLFPEPFDLLVCCEAIEHDPRPWEVWALWPRLVKPGGFLIASAPTYGFPYHGYPKDYWRPSEDAWRDTILAGWDVRRVEVVPDSIGQPCIAVAARRPDAAGQPPGVS